MIRSQRVLGALAEPDERHVRTVPRCHRSDLRDVNLARNHLVTQARHDLGEQRKAIGPLVGDQDAKVVCPVHDFTPT